MSKDFIAVGLETETVRAVRFAEKGREYVRVDELEWPISPAQEEDAADVEGAAGDAPADEVDVSADEGADGPSYAERLAEIFREMSARFKTREIVLSLPLSMTLAKGVRFPLAERDALEEDARAAIDKISPFPDEELTVDAEAVGETDSEVMLVAAALPEAASAEVGEALAAAKTCVTRTDVLALGVLRSLWPEIVENHVSRRLVLMYAGGGWDLVVMDDDAPVFLRGLGDVDVDGLVRETTLSLIRCGGARSPGEAVVVSAEAPDEKLVAAVGGFAPVRHVPLADPFAGVEGCALRTVEGNALDVTPGSWRDALKAARFHRKLVAFLATAIGLWVVAMGVLVGVPIVYDQMAAHQKALCSKHAKPFREAKALKARVQLVRKYSDHTRGALEVLKAVSDNMPPGVVLSSFQFKRDDKDDRSAAASIRVSGDADSPTLVYDFKNALVDAPPADDEEDKLFQIVKLTGPSQSRGRHKFDVDASFGGEDEK